MFHFVLSMDCMIHQQMEYNFAYNQRESGSVGKSYHTVLLSQGPPRTSNLLAPIMLLSGHEGEIYTAKFSPDGQYLASAGFDRIIRKYC